MTGLRIALVLSLVVWAAPARAQAVFDDFFGVPETLKPKPKPKPAQKPPAPVQTTPAAAPPPVQQPAPVNTAVPPPPAAPAAKPVAKPAAPAEGTPAVARDTPPGPLPKPAQPKPPAPPVQAATPPAAVPPAAPPPPASAQPAIAPAPAPAAPAAPAPSPAPPAQTAALQPPAEAPGLPPPAKPANCKNTGNFPGWLAEFRREASAAGVSQGTISDVLDTMTLDQGIINRDRGGQKVFTQSFYDFSSKLANPGRIKSAIYKINKHKAVFQRAETEFGIPPHVIAAFWALESDFGSGMGNLPILRSLATLAYDCRRGEMFRGELMAALKLIDRGDMTQAEMVGSWAGEIGQTQFLPSHVLRYAIDYDGDGRSDLFRNNADIIGTSAKFVAELGWRRGEPWVQEVRLTKNLPWQEADLAIKHPIAQWSQWGVTQIDGSPLPSESPPASLLLPMGRKGPALLAYPNFDVYLKWNQSLVYALTAAHMATRIIGAPPLSRGSPDIKMLDSAQVKELQILLNKRGWDVGEADGKLGAGTRAAVKQAQIKFGMPADSFPTLELIAALRGST